MDTQCNKWREERLAREKARIDKLRELNIKKYAGTNGGEITAGPNKISSNTNATPRKSMLPTKVPQIGQTKAAKKEDNATGSMKNVSSRKTIVPSSSTQNFLKPKASEVRIPIKSKSTSEVIKNTHASRKSMLPCTVARTVEKSKSTSEKKSDALASRKSMAPSKVAKSVETTLKSIPEISRKSIVPPKQVPKPQKLTQATVSSSSNYNPKVLMGKTMGPSEMTKKTEQASSRKSMIPNMGTKMNGTNKLANETSRKSMMPLKTSQSAKKPNTSGESVFERLYKPRMPAEKQLNDLEKLKSDPKFRDKLIKDANFILNKRHTVSERKPNAQKSVRRSISAVHFKRISKSELSNCIHKWSSSENINNVNLKEVNEDESVKEEKLVSAIKSERKKVKFQKPIYMNFNTPKPEELQARLKNWLQKRGKSIDSYHHLQCFGLHHMAQKQKESYDEDDKENIAVDSDSDNDSFSENMEPKAVETKWRSASYISSTELDDTRDTIGSEEVEMHNVDDLLLGALNDLTDLLREGFDWEQCARWLRAIRERFPVATETAAYWECRAALEERQGNLPQTLQCWEEAVVKGTERSVVEANLDQLLDKFMQLKISPNSAKKTKINPKMVDVKNAFKSTIIRFAVQQAKLRQSIQPDLQYTVTPVRRSNRLSCASAGKTPRLAAGHTPRSNRTPLVQICASMRHIDASLAGKTKFVPNDTLPSTP